MGSYVYIRLNRLKGLWLQLVGQDSTSYVHSQQQYKFTPMYSNLCKRNPCTSKHLRLVEMLLLVFALLQLQIVTSINGELT